MIDWTKSMQQTYEYYTVDPASWKDDKQIDFVTASTIERDSETDTLGSASFDVTETVPECYIRTYLKVNQNGETARECLGTFLVQSPEDKFDGKISEKTLDGYSPLIELTEDMPPIGFYVPKRTRILDRVSAIVEEHVRAPVISGSDSRLLPSDFVSERQDSWMTFTADLLEKADYMFALDEVGQIMFSPIQDLRSINPVWTYSDDNSSILFPNVTVSKDVFSVPNTVEVYVSSGVHVYFARSVNRDPNSPVSTVSRGRIITYRDTNPSISGEITQKSVQEYADNLLKSLSRIEYQITYTHGYCPVRLGDCVMINYERAGLRKIKARVIRQSIKCEAGCTVEETAVFIKDLLEEEL